MIELFDAKHLKFKKYFVISLISVAAIIFLVALWLLFLPPKVKATSPEKNAINGSLKKVEISFNKPVGRDKVSATISPQVSGEWRFEGQIWGSHLFTKMAFYPDDFLTPNEEYSIKIENISSVAREYLNNNYLFSFKSQSLPKIKVASIADGQKDVRIDLPIIVELDEPNENVVDYDFILNPEADFKKIFSETQNQFVLELRAPLRQATDYTMTVRRILIGADFNKNAEIKDDFSIKFTTKGPPGVKSYSPTGNHVFVDTNEFGVIFDQGLNHAELTRNVTTTPVVSGKWGWDESNNKLTFSATEKLKYATKYTIHINKGIHGTDSSFLSEDINLSFGTIGNASIVSTVPKNGSSGVTPGKIELTFDQEVDQASAEAAFYIEPAVVGTFSWNKNTISFAPSGLSNDQNYKFGFASGVKSIHGLPSVVSFEYKFLTKSSETILNVPLDYQDKSLSCEAASLKMALRYKGANVSENDIMNIIGFDPTIRNGGIWGDPHSAFVGDINGHQNTTGYGVYWEPIARAANNWRSAVAFTGWTAEKAAEQIAEGNPIVIWGVTGRSIARDDWQTPSGKNILAWHGEHARTLIGFKGSVSNPTHFIINDPISGRLTWTKSQFESDWASFGNAGVVVY